MGWRWHGSACALAICTACSSGTTTNGTPLSGGQGPSTSGTGEATSSGDASSTPAPNDTSGDPASTTTGAGTSSSGVDEPTGSSSSSSGGADAGPVGFDEDPGWVSFNLPLDGNDYGWRATANAGGEAGEIGGHFQRPADTSYYAHVDLAIDLAAVVGASGRINVLAVENGYNFNTFIGHFAVGDTDSGRVGVEILEPGDGAARIRLVHGIDSFDVFDIQELGIDRDWSYSYDPNAGTYGRIDVTLEGQGTVSYDLTDADRMSLTTLDAFGLLTRDNDNAGDFTGRLEAYFDDIDYTR